MKTIATLARCAAAILAFACVGAQAGGPLNVCDDAAHTPLKYQGAGTVNLNYDQGVLGSRTKSQADAIVTSSVALWTNVTTATVTIGRGADLPVDVTTVNVGNYLGQYGDGINPVIYDTDGTIVNLLFGDSTARNSILGFAGSAYFTAPTCRYAEGQAVINGFLSVTDATMSVVMAHEIGHLIGMDHTQLDSTQGLSPAFGSSNYPLMYPIAYRSFISLHEDDAAAVSALYPDVTLNSVYGQISGTFVQANGVTPVLGANLWATETTTGKVYSIVSDYLTQGTGYFKLLLPAGTYNLRAEAIDSQFTGGSGVGPYASDSFDVSFQAPLYSGSTPMPIVTLGNGTPTVFLITAGCAATLTFRINGTGTVGGNCAATPAVMVSPTPGTMLAGSSQTFSWTNSGAGAVYQLAFGNAPGASDILIYPAFASPATSIPVTGLPTDGRTLYVRLLTTIAGTTYSNDYVYTAFLPPPAAMASPTPGTQLAGASQLFSWNSVAGASLYQVVIGNSVGASDIGTFPAAPTASTSTTASGLPADGRTLYVRLSTNFHGVWYSNDYTYTAAVPPPAAMITPTPSTTLAGVSQTFTWNSVGASQYRLWVGNTLGANDAGDSVVTTAGTSMTVTKLPADGRTIFVRLSSNFSGTFYSRDYTYTASTAVGTIPAPMVSPAPGSTLAGSSQTFTWADTGAILYQVWVGNTLGGKDLGSYPSSPTSGTSTTIAGLPTDGRLLHVRVYSMISGAWYPRDYTYVAASTTPGSATPAVMASPLPGSTITTTTQTFAWNNSGATLYKVAVGTTPGASDLGEYPSAAGTTATSIDIDKLPLTGNTLYVRLSSNIAGIWVPLDYTYSTPAPVVAAPASILTPAPGSVISGASQTFTWSNSGASLYQVWVGNGLGGNDLGFYPSSPTSGTSTTITGLPTDGRTLHVRVYSFLNGSWYPRDYTYIAGP